jgi:type IV secretion system protein VirB10
MFAYNAGLMDGVLSGQAEEEESARDRELAREFSASDSNRAFARSAERTNAPTVTAGRIESLRSTIAQGKLVHAVLETAINTQLPGSVRAIVSRDIYAEAGNRVLIPKGSRLVGVYNTNLFRGQGRVFVVWNRVIRPDGIDIMINSGSTDQLGRAGVHGYVDNRYGQMFAAAGLSSILGIGVALAGEEIVGTGNQTQSIAPDGSVTTTVQSTDQAVLGAAARLGRVGERISTRIFDFRPVITIDQGTPVKVFVNRDLIFPQELLSGTRVLP